MKMIDKNIGKVFTKTSQIKVIGSTIDGYIVCNADDTKDTWVIPYNVFERTYKLVENQN